jgi:crossover junction endodeoxyribonuclease RuvC
VPCRVLGIDPGTIVLGWGIVAGDGRGIEHVASGVIRARGTRAERLAEICDVVADVCARFEPLILSLEQSFVGDNVQSAFRLGEARGAVMVAACRARIADAGDGRAAARHRQSAGGG